MSKNSISPLINGPLALKECSYYSSSVCKPGSANVIYTNTFFPHDIEPNQGATGPSEGVAYSEFYFLVRQNSSESPDKALLS